MVDDVVARRRALCRAIENGQPLTQKQRDALADIVRMLGMHKEGRFSERTEPFVLQEMHKPYAVLFAEGA